MTRGDIFMKYDSGDFMTPLLSHIFMKYEEISDSSFLIIVRMFLEVIDRNFNTSNLFLIRQSLCHPDTNVYGGDN